MARVSIGDLNFAIEWLENYEVDEDATNRGSCERMIAWLKAEVASREIDAVLRSQESALRKMARETGQPYAKLKAKLRQKIVEQMGLRSDTVEKE